MSILINQKTRVLIQGITGREGSRACREMLAYGTKVLAGVTPGKGGENVEGVPVFNAVSEAIRHYPEINASLIAVPATAVKDAAYEAIHAGIPLINILTEHVPIQDSAFIISRARKSNVRIIGPSSVGIITPGSAKIGSIGSSEVRYVFNRGPAGIISKSGGMTAEIASVLSRNGIGQSTAVGIGADQIIGSDFIDLLRLFKDDRDTKVVVIFGEVGGTYEEKAAEFIKKDRFPKPIVALIAGAFSSALPADTVLGHAGAIVAHGRGSYASKVKALRNAGVIVASSLDELPELVKRSLEKFS